MILFFFFLICSISFSRSIFWCVASWTNRYLTRALFVLKLYVHCMSTDLPHGTYSVWHHSYNGNIASLIYAVSDVARCAMWKIIRTLFWTNAYTQIHIHMDMDKHALHSHTHTHTPSHTHIHLKSHIFIHSLRLNGKHLDQMHRRHFEIKVRLVYLLGKDWWKYPYVHKQMVVFFFLILSRSNHSEFVFLFRNGYLFWMKLGSRHRDWEKWRGKKRKRCTFPSC